MYDYILLSSFDGEVSLSGVAHAVDSLCKTLDYKGSCLYFGLPSGEICLSINQGDATDSETEWFLRTLAGRYALRLTDSDGDSLFADSEDNDVSVIEQLPPPDEENLPIALRFTISGGDKSITECLTEFCKDKDYEITGAVDGFTVYFGANSFLDLYPSEDDMRIDGSIDLSIAGAGIYAEALGFAEELCRINNFELTLIDDPRVTYQDDRDFDKLRKAFYRSLAEAFAFAVNDDRDGLPAYLGWGTDGFEPRFIRGTLMTSLGRYDIERLYEEIERYGFSFVCDRYFLTCNTPRRDSEFYIKEALNVVWNSPIGGKEEYFTMPQLADLLDTVGLLNQALGLDPYAPFPKELYLRLNSYGGYILGDISHCGDYPIHFEPGYMRDEISYGFGHYLRRFKLPGWMYYQENFHGEDVLFREDKKHKFKVAVEISYNYSGDGSESNLSRNFAVADEDDIEIFDIGGSSVVRYVSGVRPNGKFCAEAEVYIRDELYRFAAVSESEEYIDLFRQSVREAISVEDWYDENIMAESPDPHAPGATFCTNGYKPLCTAFRKPFPISPSWLQEFYFDGDMVSENSDNSLDAEMEQFAIRAIENLSEMIARLGDGTSKNNTDKESDKEDGGE